jgi:hypothetical protein
LSKKIAMLVISCDKYSDLWPIFFESWFKYWPNCPLKIYLGSNFKKYDHKDITMINVGEDSDYSSNLSAMVDKIDEDYLILTVEDVFLSGPVDEENLFLYFKEFFDNGAVYLKLQDTYPVGYDNDTTIRTSPVASNIKYRLGMGLSFWSKGVLKENLVPGMSAWDMEKMGEFGRDIPACDVYSLNHHFSGAPPFQYVHGVIKGAWTRKAISWLVKEGYQELLSNRGTLSYSGTLYNWMFGKLMIIFKKINYKWRP